MKKKFLITILAIACAFCCLFGFAACDSNEATTHSHNYQWVDNGDGTHKQHCANDGCDAPDINSGAHVWDANNKCEKCPAVKPADGHTHDYRWVDNGDGTHKQHCINDGCNAPDINSENHIWGVDSKCEKCSAVKPGAGHTHNYKWINNWDGTHKQHCQNDGCDAPDINIGEHTYTIEGFFYDECDKCHDLEAPEGHTHDYQWKDDGNGTHSLNCQSEGCNRKNPTDSKEEHTWGENGICDKCNSVSVSLHKHYWSVEYYCRGDSDHVQFCDSCHIAVMNSEHSFVDGVCRDCGHKKTSLNNLTFTLNEDRKSYTVTKFSDLSGTVTDVVIPCEHFGYPVTAIAENVFKNSKITSVEILQCCVHGANLKSGITSIGVGAFSGCKQLKSVVIPQTVTEIGQGAFESCTAITDITVPFVGGSKDATGNDANFGYIFGASGYTQNASYVPSTLKNVIITGGTTIAQRAFYYCSVIDVTLPNGLTSIGEFAFAYYNLNSINIPDSVTSIGASAFQNSRITSITLPYGIQSIESSVFQNCDELAEITISSGITSIATDAFKNCNKLKKINYTGDLASWCGGIIGLDELMQFYPALYIDRQLLSGVIAIPSGVNSIVNSAFRGCDEITEIRIHSGVTNIGSNVFSGCSKLKSITVDANNTAYASQDGILYNKAKTSCIYIPSDIEGEITVPYGITRIAFSHPKITAVNLPNSMTSIDSDTFNGCTGLISITIPDSVTSIESNAFDGCTSLANITIPDSVTNIGVNAFYDTAWYKNQPDGMVYAGKIAYKYKGTMPSNTSIILADGTKGIADRAFYGETNLTSVTIPDSVTSIGAMVFTSCENLTTINFKGTKKQWDDISKSNVWNYGMSTSCVIICTDGTIAVS